jgi:hypothetical protein
LSKSHINYVKRPTVDSEKKDNKGNHGLTFHVHPELAHLLALPDHLGLQAPDLFLALTDLHGEPDSHTLSLNLQAPLLLKLALKEVDPLPSVGALLESRVMLHAEPLYGPEQIIPLFS